MVANIPDKPALSRIAQWLKVPVLAFVLTRAGILAVAYLADPLIVDSTVPPPYHI